MKGLKKIFAFFKAPPLWVLLMVYAMLILFVGVSIYILSAELNAFWVYGIYVLAFVFLVYSVYSVISCASRIKKTLLEICLKFSFSRNMVENYGFRTFVFSALTSVLNFAYAVFMVVMAVLGHSFWYAALFSYYMVLGVIRISILLKYRRKRQNMKDFDMQIYGMRLYRLCGMLLFLLTLALFGAVIQMVLSDKGFRYAELMVYVVAVFSFYKVVLAIVNTLKAKKYRNYTIQALRNINLASALVTLLSLQTTMLYAFSDSTEYWRYNGITGGLVCFLILLLGVYMIGKGSSRLKEENRSE